MPSGKPGTHEGMTVVYTRFSPKTITAIDEVRAKSPFKPSRARIIEAAVDEYIQRQAKREGAK